MQDELQILIEKANSILEKTGRGPGVRYPQELKKIIASLANDHKLSVGEITNFIPISQFSAREWPKQFKVNFRELSVGKRKNMTRTKHQSKKELNKIFLIILSLQVLFLSLQIFLK